MPRPEQIVGLNLLYLAPGETGGTETYARELIPELVRARPDWRFIAFVGREGLPADDARAMGAEPVEIPVSSRGRVTRILGEQLLLPRAARKHGVTLLHNMHSTGPQFAAPPQVTSTHDVIYASHPDAHSKLMLLGQKMLVPQGARSAERVLTLSEASKDAIVEHLGVERERIEVVPLAARTPGPATPADELRTRLELSDAPLILATSARRGHKNLSRLLEALARVEHQPAPTLVLPGYGTGAEGELEAEIARLGLTERVHLLGWISEADLDGLYAAAELVVFPSLAEGFGLPVLEAMEHGTPVATSKISSMPEVGGDAALYFDPYSVDEIAATIERLLGDAELRADLATRGLARAREFSWERAAAATVAAYEEVLGAA